MFRIIGFGKVLQFTTQYLVSISIHSSLQISQPGETLTLITIIFVAIHVNPSFVLEYFFQIVKCEYSKLQLGIRIPPLR